MIADTLNIDLNQKSGSELSFVTLINDLSSADVTIDASSLSDNATPYQMVLESRDTNSELPALVLKTDTVYIYVTTYSRSV